MRAKLTHRLLTDANFLHPNGETVLVPKGGCIAIPNERPSKDWSAAGFYDGDILMVGMIDDMNTVEPLTLHEIEGMQAIEMERDDFV